MKKARKKRIKKLRRKKAKKLIKRKVRKIKKAKKRVTRKRRATKKKIKRHPRRKRLVRRRVTRKQTTKKIDSSLEQLFESPAKVQIMKLFFRNPEQRFLLKEASKIMRINLAIARKQVKKLEKIGLLKTRQISSRKQLVSLNPGFNFFKELKELILRACPVSKEKMLKTIRGSGRIKLVLLSGVFMGHNTARADLLIVGDSINQRKLPGLIKNLESEAGADINCVVMTTEEFKYRYDMYDRFVRDLLNEKNEILFNRLGL